MGMWKKEEVPESRGAETVYRHDPTPYGYRDFDGDDEENQRGPSRYSGVPHSNQRNLATSRTRPSIPSSYGYSKEKGV